MPFLTQHDLSATLRARAEKEHRAQLRHALLNQGLSAEQRRDIQRRLAQIGQPRVYDADAPAVPGAVVLPPPVIEVKVEASEPLEHAAIQKMKKPELIELATKHGVSTQGNRAEIIKRLLAL